MNRRGLRSRLHSLKRNPVGLSGYILLLLLILIAVFSHLLAPHDPLLTRTADMLLPPSSAHWLGTDELGRDLLSRILYGLPLQLYVSLASVVIASIAGTILGVLGGYFGGWVDQAVVAFADLLFAFPAVLLAIAIVAILGPGLVSVTWAIGIVYTPRFIRINRGTTLKLRQLDYVLAAQALGARPGRVMLRHVLPNAVSPLILQATLSLSTSVITGAALDFLGLGAQPPTPAWGAMVNAGRVYLELAPWMVLGPSVAIIILCVALNLAGDGLRDLLDPQQETGDI